MIDLYDFCDTACDRCMWLTEPWWDGEYCCATDGAIAIQVDAAVVDDIPNGWDITKRNHVATNLGGLMIDPRKWAQFTSVQLDHRGWIVCGVVVDPRYLELMRAAGVTHVGLSREGDKIQFKGVGIRGCVMKMDCGEEG